MRVVFEWLALFYLFSVFVEGSLDFQVPEVDRASLGETVAEHDETLVYVYANWCEACKTFRPIYASVAEEYEVPGKRHFVQLNGGEARSVGMALVRDVYPGVALLRGQEHIDYMRAEKTRTNLEQWLEQMTGDDVQTFELLEEAEQKAKRFRVAFIATVSSKESPEYKLIQSVAAKYRSWGVWLAVIDPSQRTPTIAVKHPYEKQKIHEIKTSEDLLAWANRTRFPLFGEMDSANQHDYYMAGRDPVMLVGSHKDFKKYGITLRRLAVRYQDKFSFVWFRSTKEGAQQVLAGLSLSETPGLVVFLGTGNQREHRRFIYPGDKDTLNNEDQVAFFLDAVLRREVRPIARSMPEPGEDVMQQRSVKPVSANRFEELVLQGDKDFMLVLTAPKGNEVFEGCTKCEPLVNMLEQLSHLIEEELGESKIGFGEFLVTANEMPLIGWGGTWEFEGLPVIYFVKPGAKEPIEFKGPFSAETVVKFWIEHTDSDVKESKEIQALLERISEAQRQETQKAANQSELPHPGGEASAVEINADSESKSDGISGSAEVLPTLKEEL